VDRPRGIAAAQPPENAAVSRAPVRPQWCSPPRVARRHARGSSRRPRAGRFRYWT